MKVISITGGVGSGKSEVLRILKEEFSAQIILADQVAHQLMEPGKKGYKRVVEALGTAFLNADGSIDRKKLAEVIFQDKEAVQTMNSIIHPMVWKEIQYEIDHSDKQIVVVEAALFDEEHNAMFDEIWYVYTEQENRIGRLMASRGYTREKCLEIMSNQASEEEYRRIADRVLDNNKGVEEISTQIAAFLKEEAL
ncbi:MAG: dephospho-CoA kinase [Otoolea sp.]|nr:dephospho-CoA kinase [Clostridiaceae bacterium]MDY5484496.1 dephospho-CoA kinase [Clostridium sp.]